MLNSEFTSLAFEVQLPSAKMLSSHLVCLASEGWLHGRNALEVCLFNTYLKMFTQICLKQDFQTDFGINGGDCDWLNQIITSHYNKQHVFSKVTVT